MLKVENIRSRFTPESPIWQACGILMIGGFSISSFCALTRRWQMVSFVFSESWQTGSVQRTIRLFLLTICFSMAAQGAEVLISSATRENERYMMHTEAIVSVPVSKVRALILDYKNFPRLNADIKRVEAMQRLDDGGIRMGVRSSVCLLSICQHFDWVQDIRFLPDGDITMTIVPGQGDFRRGNGRWRLFPTDGGTRLIFDLDLTPKGWVPPVFGPWVMERKLTENAFEFAQGLETMANSN